MDGTSSDCCLLCGEQLDGNGDVASPNSCAHVFHLICIKNWADIKINTGHPVTCPLQSCLKAFQSIGVKKNSKTMKVVNVIPVDQDWNCPICLNSMSQVNEIGNPEVCNHHFCLSCLLEWSQTNTSCPLDRMEFRIIFVKNAVGGAIQRRVRTPQRDLRAELTDGESEDTEDDVEVTVANAVSNSLVAAANELMRNRILNATCPQCQLTAGPDAIVCATCNNAYHRQCTRVRGARGDLWRCLRCRSQHPPTTQRGGRRGVVLSPLTRIRRNAIVLNEFHGEFLQLLGNANNYHSSDDDTFSCDTEREQDDIVSESVDSLTSESELSLPTPAEQQSRPNIRSLPLPDDDPSSDESAILSDDDSNEEEDTDDSESNREPRQTRQATSRDPEISRAIYERPPIEPLPRTGISLRNDLFSRFSDSDDTEDSFDASATARRRNASTRHPEEHSSSGSSNTDSDVDKRDGRRSRVSHNQSNLAFSNSSDSSDSSESVTSEAMSTPSNDSSDDFSPIAGGSPRQLAGRRRLRTDSEDSENNDVHIPKRRRMETRPTSRAVGQLAGRQRVRWDSEDSEDNEVHIPKRRRMELRPTSRAVGQASRSSRPRRQAAPVDLAEVSFNFEDNIEEARPSSTSRHRNPTASSSRSVRVQDRSSSSTSTRGNRNRGGGGRGASTAASRRLAADSSASSARPSNSSGTSRRAATGSSSAARPSSSSGTSRRAATGSSSAARPSSSSGTSRRGTAAGTSRGRRSGGSARTSGKRKKKSTTRKKSGSASRKRKTSVKKHKVVRKARKRQKKARREERQPTITVSSQFRNRTQSVEGAPRLSLLGEGRFPSGAYDTMLYTPALSCETTVSSTQEPSVGPTNQSIDAPPAPSEVRAEVHESASGFLSGLLASQSRLFTPTRYLRVNASDGSLFAVSREEVNADLLVPGARRTSSPPTSESPPSANEMRSSAEASTSSSSSPIDAEPGPASSSSAVAEEEVEETEEDEEERAMLTYSPVEESGMGVSDVEVDSTPLTDISSSTLGGRMYARNSQAATTTEQSAASSPERLPRTSPAVKVESRQEELKRADFATRREFETAVANIAKRTVGNYYLSRLLSKEEYKAQLKRIVHKVSTSGHSTHKVKNIIHLAEKCVKSFIKSRSHPSHVKK